MQILNAKTVHPHMLRGLTPAVWIAVLLVSLWLRILIPPYVSPGPHDDALMATLGFHLANGDWLGDWNYLTLTKSPGYPIVIALASWASLPVTVVVHVLYLIGVLAVGTATRRIFGSLAGSTVIIMLALNPAMFGTEASRIYRNALLATLCLLIIGLSVWLGIRLRTSKWSAILLTAALLGSALGLAAITRIDSLLFLAPAIPIMVVGGFLSRRTSRSQPALRSNRPAPVAFIVFLVTAMIPGAAVIAMNSLNYQAPRIDDALFGPVSVLQSTWNSVVVPGDSSRYPISGPQRSAVYEISPAARRLSPYLDADGPTADRVIDSCVDAGICGNQIAPPSWRINFWKELSCDQAQDCTGAGGSTFFSLVDALMLAAGKDQTTYYQLASAISADIHEACRRGRLMCRSDSISSAGISGLSTKAQLEIPGWKDALRPLIKDLMTFQGSNSTRIVQRNPTDAEATIWRYSLGTDTRLLSGTKAQVEDGVATSVQALRVSYAALALLLIGPAMIGTVMRLFRRSNRGSALVSLGVATTIGIQLAVLSVLEANVRGYAAVFGQYLMPSYPALITFLVMGTSLLIADVRPQRTA